MRSVKYPIRLALSVVVVGASSAACRMDMHDAPRYEAYEESALFADGKASRPVVPGTVARGELTVENSRFYEGRDKNGALLDHLPPEVRLNEGLLARGKERYEIYCTPCHDFSGTGNGMIVRRGFKKPPSLHNTRLLEAPLGHFYEVISKGYGSMYNYAASVKPRDRWAIAAYIRALQLSHNADIDDLPPGQKNVCEVSK